MNAMMAPAGISAGARTTRPSASHEASSTPPSRNAHGMSMRWSPPTRASQQVRHDQADESDRSGQRDGGRGEQRTRDVAGDQRARHVRAARRGPRLADRQQVPVPRLPDDQDASGHDHATYTPERRIVDRVEAADQPARNRERLRHAASDRGRAE